MSVQNIGAALDAALALAAEGYAVLPCKDNKLPACPQGFKDASSASGQVRVLWRERPAPRVGVATGEVSGIDVLDLDKKHAEAPEWWATNRDRIRKTRVHRTRSGGLHLLFRHKPQMRCWTARPVVGVDGRGDGGYVIWWPAAGFPVLCDAPPTDWPDWLLGEVAAKPKPVVGSSSLAISDTEKADRYVSAALESALERIGRAGEGVRNSTLNAEAFCSWAVRRGRHSCGSGCR